MRALEYGHEHSVHHSEHADKHGEQGGAPAHGSDHTISLAAAQVFAHRHGADFRNKAVDLLTKPLDLFLGGRGSDADIDDVNFALISRDFLEERQGEND